MITTVSIIILFIAVIIMAINMHYAQKTIIVLMNRLDFQSMRIREIEKMVKEQDSSNNS